MLVTRLAAVASLLCLQSSMALAGDIVTLRCDYPAQGERPPFYETVIADGKGISVTVYTTNESAHKSGSDKIYTNNSKEDGRTSYYRINASEIAWGNEFRQKSGLISKFDTAIDRRTGIVKKNTLSIITGEGWTDAVIDSDRRMGTCKPDRPIKPAKAFSVPMESERRL